MFSTFRQDLARMCPPPLTWRAAIRTFFELSVWAVGIFRFGKWVQQIRFSPLRRMLLVPYFFLYKTCESLSGIRISIYSEIGPGLMIHNMGGVLIHGTLGRNCTIVQGAQLLARANGKDHGWLTLGDEVYVGAGAKVLGSVHVGDRVVIGANAVVVSDVPDDSVVLPPESRIISGTDRLRRRAARRAATS